MILLSPGEEKILKKIGELTLATKTELKAFLRNNGVKKDASVVVDSVVQSLLEKEFITKINPIGSTCFVITKEGSKILQELQTE